MLGDAGKAARRWKKRTIGMTCRHEGTISGLSDWVMDVHAIPGFTAVTTTWLAGTRWRSPMDHRRVKSLARP